MDNDLKVEDDSKEEKAKKVGTLNLEDISISTLSDDLAKKDKKAEESKDKNGWFSFLAKHQGENSTDKKTPEPKMPPEKKIDPAEEEKRIVEENKKDFAAIAKEDIDELKIENDLEKPVETEIKPEEKIETVEEEKPVEEEKALELEGEPKEEKSILEQQLEAFKTVGAPANLPLGKETVAFPIEPKEEADSSTTENAPIETSSEEEPAETERPSLSSFIAPKVEPDMQNKLSEMLAGKTTATENPAEPNSTVGEIEPAKKEETGSEENNVLPKIDLEEETAPTEDKNPIKIMPDIGGTVDLKPENKKTDTDEEMDTSTKNPFASKLGMKPGGDKSLLQAVESALNYSAPTEYAEERENMEDQLNTAGEPTTENGESPSGSKKNAPVNDSKKKFLIIGGGVFAGVIVLVIVLVLAFGGSSSKTPQDNANQNASVANSNANSSGPIRPLNNNSAPKPVATLIKAEKIIPESKEVPIESKESVNMFLSKLRDQGSVKKMTQLVFVDSNKSALSIKDLMDATEISIPEKIVLEPNKKPALLVADFFAGKTILGLAIKSQSDTATTLEKMKSWESTMVLDLGELWKGLPIDNPGAYFADSGVFNNGRFALIDKRSGLSLDYVVENGYILIACGKDSLTVFKSQFIPGEEDPSASPAVSPNPTPTTRPEPETENSNENVSISDPTPTPKNSNQNN